MATNQKLSVKGNSLFKFSNQSQEFPPTDTIPTTTTITGTTTGLTRKKTVSKLKVAGYKNAFGKQ